MESNSTEDTVANFSIAAVRMRGKYMAALTIVSDSEYFENSTYRCSIDSGVREELSREQKLICVLVPICMGLVLFLLALTFYYIQYRIVEWVGKRQHTERKSPEFPHFLKNWKMRTESQLLGIKVYMREPYGLNDFNTANKRIAKLFHRIFKLPKHTRVIQFPAYGYDCGKGFNDFIPQKAPSSDSYFKYQMFGNHVQATWHYHNGVKLLAGFSILMVHENPSKYQYPKEILKELIDHCVAMTVKPFRVIRVKESDVRKRPTEGRDLALLI